MINFVAFLLIIVGLCMFGWAGCAMWGMNFLWFMGGSIIVAIGSELAKAGE